LIEFLLSIFVAYLLIFLGITGKREKKERELNTESNEPLGQYEGMVQDLWWVFFLVAVFCLVVGFSELIKYLRSW
jgi:phosphatidylglycerophosphate synthase